jgi:dsDNA-specific endonuclease/ATPase MutS2
MATRTRSKRTTPRQEFNPRALLLAGVGAVSLGRKQALRSIEEAGDNAVSLRKQLDAKVKTFESRARKLTTQAEGDFKRLRKQAKGKVAELRKQARARIAPLQNRLDEVVVEVANQAQSRLGPVLARLGVTPAKRPVRKPAAKRRGAKATRRAA